MVAAAIGAGVAGTVASSALGGSAAQSAADTQANAANQAAQLQMQQFQQLQQNLKPYMDLGQNNIAGLQNMINSGQLTPQFSFNPTQQQLEQTPGYQFQLNQGLNTLNNQMAAKGLNLSGAQLRGIQDYAQGLAGTTFNQQYQNALNAFNTNYGVQSNQFNRLQGLASLGENAAAGVGNAGLQAAGQAGQALMSGANASAAGTIGAANAINSGIGALGSAPFLYNALGGGLGSGSGSIYGNAYSGFNNPANYG